MPTADFHCVPCAERIALREAMVDHHFDNIDNYRAKEVEEALINKLIDSKAGLLSDAVDENEVSFIF